MSHPEEHADHLTTLELDGSPRPRRHWMVLVAAVLVAAAAGIGFGIGVSVGGDDDDDEVTGADEPSTAAVETSAAESAPAETTAETTASTLAASGEAGDDAAVSTIAPSSGDLGVETGRSSGLPDYSVVSERTTADGLRVRVLRGGPWPGTEIGPSGIPGWQPEPWCFGNGELRVGIAGPDVIDVTGGPWYEGYPGGVVVTTTQAGWADGSLHGVVIVQVGDGATSVAAVADGRRDEADVVDGVAVLVLPGVAVGNGPVAPADGGLVVEVTGPDGTTSVDLAEATPYQSDAWREACEPPPPELPPAGEQPADPAAAEADIRARFELLFDRSIPVEDKPDDLLDDRTGVDAARAAVDEGPNAAAADSAVHTIDELVFTSPTEAWFRYHIDSVAGTFRDRYGIATFVDGSWRIARAVVCQDLALAGGPCEPMPDQIFPPSWYERNAALTAVAEEGVVAGD